MKYIIGIDQSTQGTKALLFDESGKILTRADKAHRQIVNQQGWVSHDPVEILNNTMAAVRECVEKAEVPKENVAGIGISNQRETSVIWDRQNGTPLADAIVWQCSRAAGICERREIGEMAEIIRDRTGIPLSPYFPAAKFSWLLENVPGAREKALRHDVCFGTIDSWLIYCFTEGRSYKTDYSNASRTQLFNIESLSWDPEICGVFGIDSSDMAEVCDSDSDFGTTTMGGFFEHPVPVHGVLGDSHAALFGQNCVKSGMAKATYGTGSSVMMNVGTDMVRSRSGVVSSIAWGMGGQVTYVLEGNINYTGAVISWLKDDVGLISSAAETEAYARAANPEDETYLVPAFSGLGAPYWDDRAKGILTGITRMTGKAEIVRAALDCIAYQITDVIRAMEKDAAAPLTELRADGGPTKNAYLMQLQSDLLGIPVSVPDREELSGMGAAYAAGLGMKIFDPAVIREAVTRKEYLPGMEKKRVEEKMEGWKAAVETVLRH